VTIHLSGTPLAIERAMPAVGEHNAEVLQQWLGMRTEQVAALEAEGAL
jgi:crotonobetainyl-CoA:carnitine CoA-transferase CaiB-like acyl-CoA transferase